MNCRSYIKLYIIVQLVSFMNELMPDYLLIEAYIIIYTRNGQLHHTKLFTIIRVVNELEKLCTNVNSAL